MLVWTAESQWVVGVSIESECSRLAIQTYSVHGCELALQLAEICKLASTVAFSAAPYILGAQKLRQHRSHVQHATKKKDKKTKERSGCDMDWW